MMPYVLLAGLLLAAPDPAPAQAQTRPATPAQPTSLDSRVHQYFTDLAQRLREVYRAPSDGRAIALLSSTITEFTARRKGLLPEVAQQGRTLSPAARAAAAARRQQARQELPASPAAAKMSARRQRNPALDYAFRHFDEAQLTTLAAPAPAAE